MLLSINGALSPTSSEPQAANDVNQTSASIKSTTDRPQFWQECLDMALARPLKRVGTYPQVLRFRPTRFGTLSQSRVTVMTRNSVNGKWLLCSAAVGLVLLATDLSVARAEHGAHRHYSPPCVVPSYGAARISGFSPYHAGGHHAGYRHREYYGTGYARPGVTISRGSYYPGFAPPLYSPFPSYGLGRYGAVGGGWYGPSAVRGPGIQFRIGF
jgi:hypothetical protein